ncbi:CRISPR-associated endoribonuclease Cas6 [Alkalinema pantanalense CENA528]
MPQPPKKSQKPPLTWPNQPDLIGLQFTLQPQQNCTLPSNYTYWLHAWFLDQIRTIDPNISAFLHDNQTEKAFTLSAFLGEIQTHDRSLSFSSSHTYHCHITALCAPVCQALRQWLTQPPQQLTLKNTPFQILNWQIALPATTYEALWDSPPPPDLSLTFLSPTGFRKNGNHMPLPIPENLFHSYLRRWNTFAHLEFEQDEFLAWVNECVVLLRHDIRSRKVQPGKQGSVTGFIGSIQLGLTPKAQQEPEYVQLVHALIQAAPYFGTGHKITFGLGQTRLGWMPTAIDLFLNSVDDSSDRAAENSIYNSSENGTSNLDTDVSQLRKMLIKTRTAELEQQFIRTRKRQGGDRAKNIAHLWATIVARQETGDSLKAIAADLNLPYETVKKYAQLARKQLAEF